MTARLADLRCGILIDAGIDQLCENNPDFKFLQQHKLRSDAGYIWKRRGGNSRDLSVMVTGKTGYGKSTLLNALTGSNVFETSDVQSCTRLLQSAEYRLPGGGHTLPHYLSLCDLPGLGENPALDADYLSLYHQVMQRSQLVIWVLRADQRDFVVDMKAMEDLFPSSQPAPPRIIVLNMADKVEPISRSANFLPHEAQLRNLRIKQQQVSRMFDIAPQDVVITAANNGYGLDMLVQRIISHIQCHFLVPKRMSA